MFLLILDKNPYKAAELIPDRLKFKSLLELCQLICSAGISDVYKKVNQGKELQEWVKKYKFWVLRYFSILFDYAKMNLDLKCETIVKISKIYKDLCTKTCWVDIPQTAIFRYVKEYAEMTSYESNSELPIDLAVEEYRKYIIKKEEWYNEKRKRNKRTNK